MTHNFVVIILLFLFSLYIKKVLMVEKEQVVLLRKVEANCNRKMKTPADFDFLAGVIWNAVHESISSSTLKRVWGYAGKETDARFVTKTILSRYIGYKDWDDFVERLNSPEIESNRIFFTKFEGAGDDSVKLRINKANEYYQKFGGT